MNRFSLQDFQGGDDLTRFRRAADALRAHPGSTLVIPPGDYLLRDPEAAELQRAVMYGEYGACPQNRLFTASMEYVVGIDFSSCRDVTVEGSGARLFFDGFLEPILLRETVNFTLRGIILDTVRRPFSSAWVESCGGGKMILNFGEQPLINARMPMLRAVITDGNGRWIRARQSLPRDLKLTELGGGRIQLENDEWEGSEGGRFFVSHSYHFRPAIHLWEAVNSKLEEVTIHSHHGMGVVAFHSTDITLRRCAVIPAPGEGISTNTDATHFASCRGALLIEQCAFRNHGDDAANVHNYYHTVTAVDGNQCTLEMRAPTGTHSQKEDLFAPGDTLELTSPENLARLEEFKVVRHVSTGVNRGSLILDRPLPEHACGKLLCDIDLLPRFTFRDNVVAEHFGRGVLVKCRHVRICNNTFSGVLGTAVQIAGEAYWAEGAGCEDVRISRNRIWDCGRVACSPCGIMKDTGGIVVNVSAKDPHAAVHRDVAIEDNVVDCPRTEHAIYAGNTVGMTVDRNQMRSKGNPLLVCDCQQPEGMMK